MRVAVVSLKGGVGKTFVATNLATYLTLYHKKKVLLIDLNGKIANAFLFTNANTQQTEHLYQGIQVTQFFHLKQTDKVEGDVEKELELLEKVYDFIVFDVPPNFHRIKQVEPYVDVVLLVTSPTLLSLYTNFLLYKFLDQSKVKLVVNMYGTGLDSEMISAIFKKNISVVIPYSKDVLNAENYLVPLVAWKKNSKVSRAIDDLAYVLTGIKLKRGLLELIFSFFF